MASLQEVALDGDEFYREDEYDNFGRCVGLKPIIVKLLKFDLDIFRCNAFIKHFIC